MSILTVASLSKRHGKLLAVLDSHWQTGILFLAGAAWAAVLLCVSYRVYMKRDL